MAAPTSKGRERKAGKEMDRMGGTGREESPSLKIWLCQWGTPGNAEHRVQERNILF